MYNVFTYEQQAKKLADQQAIEEKEALSTSKPGSVKRDNRMVNNYKVRITKFLRNQTKEPIMSMDANHRNLMTLEVDSEQRKGPRMMHHGAFRTDRERLDSCKYKTAFVETKPTGKPEHMCWDLRNRDRSKEIGPQFRFNNTIQVERVMDKLSYDTGKYFDNREVMNDKKTGFSNEVALSQWKKNRLYNFVPGLKADDYDSESDLHAALERDGKLMQTSYVIPPRRIMSTMHQKTYFNATQGLKLGVNSLKIKSKEFNEDFVDMANNLAKLQKVNERRTRTQGGALNTAPNVTFNNRSKSDCSTIKKQQDEQNQKAAKAIEDGDRPNSLSNEGDEEDRRLDHLEKMRNKQIDYSGLTTDVLKLCNQVRQPRLAQPKNFLRKGKGPGGWGGHVDEPVRATTSYGRKGFGPRPEISFRQQKSDVFAGADGSQKSKNMDMSIDNVQDNSTIQHGAGSIHKSLVMSESRGLLVRRKTVVLRKELVGRLPKGITLKDTQTIQQ